MLLKMRTMEMSTIVGGNDQLLFTLVTVVTIVTLVEETGHIFVVFVVI